MGKGKVGCLEKACPYDRPYDTDRMENSVGL